jgi:hypothetical protein
MSFRKARLRSARLARDEKRRKAVFRTASRSKRLGSITFYDPGWIPSKIIVI